jgi:hypothetical protein
LRCYTYEHLKDNKLFTIQKFYICFGYVGINHQKWRDSKGNDVYSISRFVLVLDDHHNHM